MANASFRQRSGRVIALSRLVLAAVFLGGIWLVPDQAKQPDAIYLLFLCYALWSAVVLCLTWSNWWLDFKLAVTAHAVDIGAFGVMVYYTEGYTSPYYIFFVFLVLSAAIRWGRWETAITAAVVLFFYMAAGSSGMLMGDADMQLQRMLIRSSYLVVLSGLLIWFGTNQPLMRERQAFVEDAPLLSSAEAPIEDALRLARQQLGASRVVLAWWQQDEPWLNVSELSDRGLVSHRFQPGEFAFPLLNESVAEPFLFDVANDRALFIDEQQDGLPQPFSQAIDSAFASEFGLTEGVAIKMRAREYDGELFALGIDGMCTDDLWAAAFVGESLTKLFDRSSAVAVSEEAAVGRAKASLARDLHDSVVQVLAGTSFRLEGLRRLLEPHQKPANDEIDTLKAELATEQRKVRGFIDMLRSGRDGSSVDLRSGMRKLVEEVKQRWDVQCELVMAPLLPASFAIQHEVQQIIREAVANAKRHGGASMVTLDLNATDDDLLIRIVDDGKGFGVAGKSAGRMADLNVQPWSVQERVQRLGGAMQLKSGSTGTELSIRVPIGPDR